MELPRNTTLVGEIHPKQKIYVEDYVISYLKQIHKANPGKEIGVALYGKKSSDEEETYYFLYGAMKMDSLVREVKHFSQAQLQEAEKIRKKLFSMYRFCGFCMVSEDELEEIVLYEDNHLETVSGYVRFYEKNDLMLELLLADRDGSPCEGVEDMGRYEAARDRQQERREYYYPGETFGDGKNRKVTESKEDAALEGKAGGWWAVAICGAALFFLFMKGKDGNDSLLSKLNSAYQSVKTSVSSVNLNENDSSSEEGETLEISTTENQGNKTLTEVGTIVTDEALGQVVLEENQKGEEIVGGNELAKDIEENIVEPEESKTTDHGMDDGQSKESVDEAKTDMGGSQSQAEGETNETEKAPSTEKEGGQETYVICKGDTLIGISMSRYGTLQKVEEICKLNRIDNPDNIQIGQKILLP